jgi:ElaB/YqjD/DUF883 family membrane-anchored ribosome-binding protein
MIMAEMNMGSKGRDEHQAQSTMDKARQVGSQAVDKAKEAASSVGHMASQAAASVGTLAKDAASSVGHMASQAASSAGKTADNLTASAGSGLKKLGDTIGSHTPREGVLGSASQGVANSLREGGRYLEEAKLSGVFEDLTDLVRRNPVPAILIGVGVGFLIGRSMRR